MANGIFDPHYTAKVFSELLSRQRGREVEITLTPKDLDEKSNVDPAGG